MEEKIIKVTPGAKVIVWNLLLFAFSIIVFIVGVAGADRNNGGALSVTVILIGIAMFLLWTVLTCGFFILQPNQAAALILFGDYKGTVKEAGWHWGNPFYTKKKISLRSRNINGEKLKVNDEMGNPIEIAAVVVWRVENSFQALFDVEDYTAYVTTQSESALRHLAGKYPYDIPEEHEGFSLRGSADEVSETLKVELQQRLGKAGVVVEEARLSHLAYAPEIAAVMLQRQQAAAIIAARQKIVEGAVGMVQMAIAKLNENEVVDLDEERKAAMVSNLMVVLCGEKAAQPVINTGTLHN